MDRFAGWPNAITGISILASYHAIIKPTVWAFLLVAISYRILGYFLRRNSARFMPPSAPLPPPPAKVDAPEEKSGEDVQPVPPLPETKPEIHVSSTAATEEEAIGWLVAYGRRQASTLYRLYELWVPLIMRHENEKGVPAWARLMHIVSASSVLVLVAAVLFALGVLFSFRIAQDPILGLAICDREMIDAALHCDSYTGSCHLTPPCGTHDVDYGQLIESYHDRCTGKRYPKIAMTKSVCFMEKGGETNSWKPTWLKLVGSDFYNLEHTLIAFYKNKVHSASELRALVREPVRVFYDQLGALVGYGVNTITGAGVVRTNINHDDLMTVLTTWRTRKFNERRRLKPCICAPHLGILSSMMFIWEDKANTWQIYLDHNVSSYNTVHGDGRLVPLYDDFPRTVDFQIAASVRNDEANRPRPRSYPSALTIDLLETRMDISPVRPLDIQKTQQIRRHWSLEGPILQTQIPHVYFDASLEAFHSTQSTNSIMPRDGTVQSQRIIDPQSSCYYHCARIFDEVARDEQ